MKIAGILSLLHSCPGRSAFDARGGGEQRGWGRPRASAATEEARVYGGGGGSGGTESARQRQAGATTTAPGLQNAMDTAGYNY